MDLNNDYLQDAQYKSASNWNAAADAAAAKGTAEVVTTGTSQSLSSIVGGTSVTTVVATDFEKLLATLQLETEETKRKNAIQLLSDTVSKLSAQLNNLSAADKAAVDKITTATEQKKMLELELSLKTQELENYTENQREQQKETNEKIRELKAQIAEQDKVIENAYASLSAAVKSAISEAAKLSAAVGAIEFDNGLETEEMKKIREKFEALQDSLLNKIILPKIPASDLPGHEVKA